MTAAEAGQRPVRLMLENRTSLSTTRGAASKPCWHTESFVASQHNSNSANWTPWTRALVPQLLVHTGQKRRTKSKWLRPFSICRNRRSRGINISHKTTGQTTTNSFQSLFFYSVQNEQTERLYPDNIHKLITAIIFESHTWYRAHASAFSRSKPETF